MTCKIAIVSGLVAAVLAFTAQAGTQGEYQALRSWCVERNKHKDDLAWQSANNPKNYFHFQHFCSAMRAMDKMYSARNRQEVQYSVSLVQQELGYVITHVPVEHSLMPEVYALRGKAEFFGNAISKAEVSLVRALQLDPNHVGAHITLVDLYIDTKRKDKAIEAIRAAIAVAPEHKGVRHKAKELGVDVPEIVAQEKKLEDAPAQPEKPVISTVPKVEAEPTVATPQPAMAPAENETEKASTQGAQQTKGGTANNPWCRFCVQE